MFLGHANFSVWLTAQLLAVYGRKRFGIQNQTQRQGYLFAHQDSKTSEWKKPVDLNRVCFTNLSMYNTEYSVFKYLLETELDVLKHAPYNQITVYTEVINHRSSDTFINPIDNDTFLVGIHSGRIQQISTLFLSTDVVTKMIEPLSKLSEINQIFLKSFAMELAVKATIYLEFSKIFNQHPIILKSHKHLENSKNWDTIPKKYQNDYLVGTFLSKEIQTRTKALVESAFFDGSNDANTLTNEVLQLCIASIYLYYAHQSTEKDDLSAAERVFCTFNALIKNLQATSKPYLKP